MDQSTSTFEISLKSFFAVCMTVFLAACGGENDGSAETSPLASTIDDATKQDPATPEKGSEAVRDLSDEEVEAYRNKVKAQMKKSFRNSMVRDYGITEAQADCLMEHLSASQLITAQSDPDVEAQIRECGVDPAVIK